MSVPSRTLCLTLRGLKKGMFGFVTERDWNQESFYGKNTMGVIWFHLSFTFLVLILKNTASIFPEIFFIQYFTIVVVHPMTSSPS